MDWAQGRLSILQEAVRVMEKMQEMEQETATLNGIMEAGQQEVLRLQAEVAKLEHLVTDKDTQLSELAKNRCQTARSFLCRRNKHNLDLEL